MTHMRASSIIRSLILGTASLCLAVGCGSDAPDAPPATSVQPPVPSAATGSTSPPPASIAGQDSANTLGAPGSFGEGTGSSGG